MALSVVQTAQNNNSGGFANSMSIPAFGSAVASGNCIVVAISATELSNQISSVTDNKSNTYTRAGSVINNPTSIEVWIAQNVTGGSGLAITVNSSGFNLDCGIAVEVSGVLTSGTIVDVFKTGTGTGKNLSSGNATTTNANDMLLGIGLIGINAGSWTPGTGYTINAHINDSTGSFNGFVMVVESKVVSSTGSNSATATYSQSNQWSMILLALKGSAGASAQTITPSLVSRSPTTHSPTITLVDQYIAPALVSSSPTVHAPTVKGKNTLNPSLVTHSPTVYAPSLIAMFPSGTTSTYQVQTGDALSDGTTYYWRVRAKDINGSDTWGNWSATRSFSISSVQTIAPSLVSRSPTVYVPSVKGQNTLTPSMVSRSAATFVPVVKGHYTLAPSFVSHVSSVFSLTMSTGPVTITVALVASLPTIFAPSIKGEYTIIPAFISRSAVPYTPTMQAVHDILPALLSHSNAVYAPAMSVGPVTILPAEVASNSAVYAPQVSSGAIAITPDLISHPASVYTPLVKGIYALLASFLSRNAAVYAPNVHGQYTIAPTLVSRTPVAYQPSVMPGAVTISAALVSRAPDLYTPSLAAVYTITVSKVSRSPAAYDPAITTERTILVAYLSRSTQTYDPTVYGEYTITPELVTSSPTVYLPSILIAKIVHGSLPITIGQHPSESIIYLGRDPVAIPRQKDGSITLGAAHDAITIGQIEGPEPINL